MRFPCAYMRCVEGYDCAASGDTGVLEAIPSPCVRIEGYTLVEWERREKLEYRREDGFCVTYEPVKSVLPLKVCDYFDELMEGKVSSRVFLGPGGTGKTLTLDIIRRTALFNVIEVEAETLLRSYVGESEQQLYKLLSSCEATEPCLMVMDEGDILLQSRFAGSMRTGEGTHAITANLIRILLRRLQRWYNEKRMLGMAVASNLPASMIEKPLLRAGRLGEPIYFPIPDRRAILKLAELYGKQLTEDEIAEMIRYALPHSNIVEYFKTGKLKKWVPEAFAGLEYAAVSSVKRRLGLREDARIIVAEEWTVGVKIAAIISSVEYQKPVLYLKDVSKLQDLDMLGRTMELPIAVPFTHVTAEVAETLLYDYPRAVFFVGAEWQMRQIRRISLDDAIRAYGPATVSRNLCGKEMTSPSRLRQMLQNCISGFERLL